MEAIKKKLSNLKIQVDEAEDRASEAERKNKELEEEKDQVYQLLLKLLKFNFFL